MKEKGMRSSAIMEKPKVPSHPTAFTRSYMQIKE
jgi:hypothetical protein